MTQSIVVQVGQCGNQIGCRFWDLALREHAAMIDRARRVKFRSVKVNIRLQRSRCVIGISENRRDVQRARAVLVDMEEGVVNAALNGPMGEIFDPVLKVVSTSGSGNNWATGYYSKLLRARLNAIPATASNRTAIHAPHSLALPYARIQSTDSAILDRYGTQYRSQLLDTIRSAAEACDCLQSFLVLHSMGGGTGSGLGTSVLGLLADEFPDVYRFVTAVFPSRDDDVVTSPYNTMMALSKLTAHAHCVLPVENEALADICRKIEVGKRSSRGKVASGSALSDSADKKLPWTEMNGVVAHTLLQLTAGSRFEGSLNVDLNEITTNLVPFPTLHYLLSSLTPLYALSDVAVAPRKLNQMFSDAFAPEYQLTTATPRRGVFLACALMVRGDVEISDVRRNIARLRPTLNFVPWNQEGWKTGLCSVPPLMQRRSLLTLSNNTSIGPTFAKLRDRHMKLYRSKAYVHHFTSEGMDAEEFSVARESCENLISQYADLEKGVSADDVAPRLQLST